MHNGWMVGVCVLQPINIVQRHQSEYLIISLQDSGHISLQGLKVDVVNIVEAAN